MSRAVETLRSSALFAPCSPEELDDVVRRSREVALAPGELLFDEEQRAEGVWVLLDGEVVVTKIADGDELVIDHLGPGGYLGEISLLTATRAQHRARAKGAARLLEIPGAAFRELIRSCDGVMEAVLRTMAERVRRVEHLLRQRERMAGLGTLAASLAHELKNPASAAHRAIGHLREHLDALEPLARRLARHTWAESEVGLLAQLEEATRSPDQRLRELDSVERSDREEALATWLAKRGVQRPWELAPLLVDRGLTGDQLDRIARGCDATVVADALAWTERMAALRQLLNDAAQSTSRIAELAKAIKAFSYVDTTTLRTADVHDGIEQSLTILGHKLREAGAKIVRTYDRGAPPIQTYGTELTQAWTNLLDNAADAVASAGAAGGTVTVKTARDGDSVLVEVRDTGGGIPAEKRAKIFEPFYTTKGAGKGTGLGLEIVRRIVRRHGGTIDVASSPGDTRFTVRLPVTQPGQSVAAPPAAPSALTAQRSER